MNEPRKTSRWLILGLGAMTLGLGYAYVRDFLKIDPFASVRNKQGLDKNVGIRLEDVNLKMYREGDLLAEADIDRVDVREDRLFLDLFGIHNGLFFNGTSAYKFEADRAKWHTNKKVVEVMRGGRISGEDLDLLASEFSYDQASSEVRIPGTLRGRLLQGEIMAASLNYNLETGEGVVGPMEWTGPATIAFDQGEVPLEVGRSWTVSAPNGETRILGDVAISDGGVTATDGEVIVMAESVEHNRKTGVLIANGRVRYFSADVNMECPKATIYRKEKRALFTGGVTMLIKPEGSEGPAKAVDLPAFKSIKPDDLKVAPPSKRTDEEKKLDGELRSSETARQYPTAMRAGTIEYFYAKGARRANISGNPEAHQSLTGSRWRRLWTHRAVYDGEKERLTLFSSDGNFDTRVKTSLGDDMVAKQVEVSTRKGQDDMIAKQARGDIYDDDEDLSPPKTTGGAQEPPPTRGVDGVG